MMCLQQTPVFEPRRSQLSKPWIKEEQQKLREKGPLGWDKTSSGWLPLDSLGDRPELNRTGRLFSAQLFDLVDLGRATKLRNFASRRENQDPGFSVDLFPLPIRMAVGSVLTSDRVIQ